MGVKGDIKENKMNKKKHVLQWHITHECNLRCSHCYQEDYSAEKSYPELEMIFFQYHDFCCKYNFKGHINFTGGEPFLSENLFPLLDLCEKYGYTFGILTNGTLLNQDIADILSKYNNLCFVQVSIDGIRETHDMIRGKGSFDLAFSGLKFLKKSGIQTMVSFTCHRGNLNELKKVIRIIRKNKIDRFWTDRLIPMGCNSEDIMSTDEFREYIRILTYEHNRKSSLFHHYTTDVHLNRALQFSEGGNCYYQCSAGVSLLTVLADGTLLPCRRLPVPVGNCFDSDIITLYENSDLIRDLKMRSIPDECMMCPKAELCRGGARCLTYAVTGDYHGKDINCYCLY